VTYLYLFLIAKASKSSLKESYKRDILEPEVTSLNSSFFSESNLFWLVFIREAINYIEGLKNNKIDNLKREVLILTHGREFSREIYLEAFSKVKRTFYILGWRLEKIGDKYQLLRQFKSLVKRKIDVRIILTGSLNKKWDLVRDYIEEGIMIRYMPLDNFSIFILDAKECKITLKDKSLMDKFNIQIIDESLSKFMQNYFLECWSKAKEVNEVI